MNNKNDKNNIVANMLKSRYMIASKMVINRYKCKLSSVNANYQVQKPTEPKYKMLKGISVIKEISFVCKKCLRANLHHLFHKSDSFQALYFIFIFG